MLWRSELFLHSAREPCFESIFCRILCTVLRIRKIVVFVVALLSSPEPSHGKVNVERCVHKSLPEQVFWNLTRQSHADVVVLLQ